MSSTSKMIRSSLSLGPASPSHLPSPSNPSSNWIRHISTRSRTPHDPNSTASTRIYTPRKSYLYQTYHHLLENNKVVLLFQPNNLDSRELSAIRKAIKSVPLPRPSSSSQSPAQTPEEPSQATLTITRTGLLHSLTRTSHPSLTQLLNGPTALITIPHLSPPYIQKVLAAINRSLGYRPPPIHLPLNPTDAGSGSQPQPSIPTSSRLLLLGGLIDQTNLLSAYELTQLLSLPDLDTLRGQLVGLLEGSGRGLVGVVQQGGGVGLVRTLMGLEAGLREGPEQGQGEGKQV